MNTSVNEEPTRGFNDLPDAAFVRVETVAALYSVTPVSIWRWSKADLIPRPRKLGPQVTAWNVGDLHRALSSVGLAIGRAARQPPPPISTRKWGGQVV